MAFIINIERPTAILQCAVIHNGDAPCGHLLANSPRKSRRTAAIEITL